MFYSDMSDKSIEFESKAKDVMMVAAVSDHKAPVRFTRENLLRGLARQRPPVPASVLDPLYRGRKVQIVKVRVRPRSWLRGRVLRGDLIMFVTRDTEAASVINMNLDVFRVRDVHPGWGNRRKSSLARVGRLGLVPHDWQFKQIGRFLWSFCRWIRGSSLGAGFRSEETWQGLLDVLYLWSMLTCICTMRITFGFWFQPKAEEHSAMSMSMRFRVFTVTRYPVDVNVFPGVLLAHVGDTGPLPQVLLHHHPLLATAGHGASDEAIPALGRPTQLSWSGLCLSRLDICTRNIGLWKTNLHYHPHGQRIWWKRQHRTRTLGNLLN